MISQLNRHKTGLALGVAIGAWHLTWALLVAAGWAQVLIDFIFWLHFIKPVYVIDSFGPVRAVWLFVVTAVTGYIVGYVFALFWNHVHR